MDDSERMRQWAAIRSSRVRQLNKLGPLAQSVEQRTFNPWVVGSSPTGPTHVDSLKNFEFATSKDFRRLILFKSQRARELN